MNIKKIVETWFGKWESGDYLNLPISANFKHSSPFGTINGKKEYINLIESNRDKFLGYHFMIHDGMYDFQKACVRYTAVQRDFKLDVSEWYIVKDDLITEIIAYYHIGDIREDRKLNK